MGVSTRLDRYDFEYYQLIERQAKGTIDVPLGRGEAGRKAGVQLRQQLYGFRAALEKVQHPHALLCKTMMIRLIEDANGWKLEVGPSAVSLKQALARTQALPSLEAAAMEASTNANAATIPTVGTPAETTAEKFIDPMDSALDKLGYFTGVKKRESK